MTEVIGLEMDNRKMRAVKLIKNKAHTEFVTRAFAEMPPGAFRDGLIIDSAQILDVLKGFWRTNRFGHTPVVLGVRNSDVLVRVAELDGSADIEKAASAQLKESIPFNSDEAVIDYSILEQKETKNVTCLLVGAKKDMLNQFIDVILDAGINLLDIEASGLALTRLTPYPDKTVMLADLGYKIGDIVIVEKGIPKFIKFVPNDLNKQNASNNDVAKYVAKVMEQSATYYESQGASRSVERIVLSGTTAISLADLLQQMFDIPVEILKCQEAMQCSMDLAEYAVAVGLALGGLT